MIKELSIIYKDSYFVTKKAKEVIKKLNSNDVFSIKTEKYQFFLYSKNLILSKIKKLKEVSNRIENIYNQYNFSKKLVFIIIDNPEPRFLSNNISAQDINGGFTIRQKNHIFIYRYIEYPKVILHELFHHIYNFIGYENKELISKYGNINLDEAITEFLATIKHLEFISKNQKHFQELLKKEIRHSKLLSRYIIGIDYGNRIFSTNIKSYILVKYILLLSYKEVLKYIDEKNILDGVINNILMKYDMRKLKKIKINDNERIEFSFMLNSDT